MKKLSPRTVPLAVLAVAAILHAATPAAAEFRTPTAITNVSIVAEPGAPPETGTIVMDEGRILAAGSEADVPPHARLIDGVGLFAYPGLIDAGLHLGLPETPRSEEERQRMEDVRPDPAEAPLPETRPANRRGIRPHFTAREGFNTDDKDRKAHRSAGFTAALVTPRPGILAGRSDLLARSDQPLRRLILRPEVAMHAGFDPGEPGSYPRTLLGVFAQFRQTMMDAQWHARMRKYEQRHPTTAQRAPSDPALDALQPLLAREQRVFFEANTEREIRRALRLADEFGLDLVITGAKEAWKTIDALKERRIPLIVSIDFPPEPNDGKDRAGKRKEPDADTQPDTEGDAPDATSAGKPEKDSEESEQKIYEPLKVRNERRRLWEEKVHNTIKLQEAGIPFAFRTHDLKKPAEFWTNLRMVIERGLSEETALAALTTNPADLVGMADQLGTIRRGRLAHVTVMDRPLSDEKARIRYVFIDGHEYEVDDGEDAGRRRDRKQTDNEPGQRPETEPEGDMVADASESPQPPEDDGATFESEIEADRKPAIETGGDVLIRGATIIPVTAEPIRNGSILIRNGVIEAIGPDIEAPPGVTVINATGRFAIPGIVDCHSHLGLDAVNESPLAISAEVRIADVINPTSLAIYRAVAGGATTHHAMHGSANPIGGQNAILKLKYGRTAEEMLMDAPGTIKFALGENVTRANWQRAWGRRFPGTRMGVEFAIRAAMETARQYRDEWTEYERNRSAGMDVPPPRKDLRLEALTRVLSGDLSVHAHCYRSDEILRLLHVAEDYGYRIGTLQHVLEGYRIAPEIARHGAAASTFANFWAYKLEAYGATPFNAALMTRAGVNVSINSDSPNTIRYLNQEAAKCIRWGDLSPDEALRLVTINPARQLLIDDRVGSLEVGKDGDVAIFNGHPLNTFSKCVMTLIEGEMYFEDDAPEAVEPADVVDAPGPVDRTIPETPHRAYAITGATVHPISRPVIENGTVVIVEDTIHAVGTDVPIPPGAGVIDGSGLHVYPGLIDAGSRLGTYEIGQLRITRDYDDTPTFSPHLRTESAVHPHSEHIAITRYGGTTTALTQPAGARIAGQSAIIHLHGWTAPEMLLTDRVGLHMSVPSLPVHLPDDAKRKKEIKEDYEKDLKALEKYLEKARHYAKVKALAQSDPRIDFDVDLDLEAMVPYITGEKPVIFNAGGYREILDTIDFAEKHELRCIISGGREAWKLAEALADKKIPVIVGTPLSYPRGQFEPWDSVYRNAGILDRAGVPIAFASDSASAAYNLGIQAGMAVAHGLPRERAEYALTLGAARILGIDDRVGSIEEGKLADLIVTTGTPVQTVTQVTHMFIAGEPVSLESMHTRFYEKFRDRPDPTLPPPPDLVGPPSLTRKTPADRKEAVGF